MQVNNYLSWHVSFLKKLPTMIAQTNFKNLNEVTFTSNLIGDLNLYDQTVCVWHVKPKQNA